LPSQSGSILFVFVKNAQKFAIVLVTAPDLKTARAIAAALLRERLVACVNLIPKIESHYWWQGKIESGREVLMVMKTARRHFRALEKVALEKHPYDTAEIVTIALNQGTPRYLDWMEQCMRP